MTITVVAFFGVLIFVMLGTTIIAGRSPHVTYRPEQMDVAFNDLKGVDLVGTTSSGR